MRRKIRKRGTCKGCGCEISLVLRNSYITKYGSIGLRCKECTGRSRAEKRELKYGVTPEGFAELLESQLGGCAICHEPHVEGIKGKGLCVDHCHKTGAVRGLLCRNCNSGIGMLKDSLTIVQSAARYLGENTGLNEWEG